MKIGSAFPSKFVKAADLNGKEINATIARVVMEDVGTADEPEDKPVLYLVGKTKGIVLNRTNATAIALKYGDDTDAWANKAVTIYPDTVMFNGNRVPCIRMRTPAEVATAEDEPPF